MQKGGFNILTSRPNDRLIGLNSSVELQTKPLSKEQALNLVRNFDYYGYEEKFYEELKNGLYEKYQSFVSNPLLLTIMFITYIERYSIPESLNEFY